MTQDERVKEIVRRTQRLLETEGLETWKGYGRERLKKLRKVDRTVLSRLIREYNEFNDTTLDLLRGFNVCAN